MLCKDADSAVSPLLSLPPLFLRQGLMLSPGWPQTCYVAKMTLNFLLLLLSHGLIGTHYDTLCVCVVPGIELGALCIPGKYFIN